MGEVDKPGDRRGGDYSLPGRKVRAPPDRVLGNAQASAVVLRYRWGRKVAQKHTAAGRYGR